MIQEAFLDENKKVMQLKTIDGDILRIFFSMKNKIILNQ